MKRYLVEFSNGCGTLEVSAESIDGAYYLGEEVACWENVTNRFSAGQRIKVLSVIEIAPAEAAMAAGAS